MVAERRPPLWLFIHHRDSQVCGALPQVVLALGSVTAKDKALDEADLRGMLLEDRALLLSEHLGKVTGTCILGASDLLVSKLQAASLNIMQIQTSQALSVKMQCLFFSMA
jgi:hypothetical protein